MALVPARQVIKDPDAVLDYGFNWAPWLDGDTISASTWTADTGITAVSPSNTTTTTSIWLTGGTDGAEYMVRNHITTTGGRSEDRTLHVRMQHR
jgi:hypothetical protein